MKLIKFFIIILILSPFFSYSEEYKYKYAIPSNSPLSAIKSSSGPEIYFSGKVVVTAKYEFIYDFDGSKGLPHNPHLLIYPDLPSLEILPYLTERGRDERPNEIMIHNPQEVTTTLFGTTLAEKISNGEYSLVSGKAEFILHEYGAAYECDSPFFWAYILKIKKVLAPHKLIDPKKN